jgi:hypothetical protein
MNILYAVVLMSLFGGEDPIPTEPGTTWVFEKTERGKPVRERWEIVRLPAGFSGTIHFTKVDGTAPGIVGIEVDGKIRYLLRTLPGEQRLYATPSWGGDMYMIVFVIPRALKHGASWETQTGHFSCGLMIISGTARSIRKRWASAPWDPTGAPATGFLLDSDHGSLEIVPGVGIVALDRHLDWKRTRVVSP